MLKAGLLVRVALYASTLFTLVGYIVMQACSGGELFDVITRKPNNNPNPHPHTLTLTLTLTLTR